LAVDGVDNQQEERMNSRQVSIGVLWMVLAVLSATVFAQERPAPKKFATAGVIELGGSAMFQYSTPVVDGKTGEAGWMLVATPSVGYFIIDDLSVGAEPLGVAVDHHAGSTSTSLRFLGSAAYHFRVNRIFFVYVQGLAGYTAEITSASGSQTTRSGFSFGGRLGGKFPIAERGMINAGVHYLMIAENPAGASNRYGSNELAATVGFAIWL
jgi:hypothetical protein